MTSNGQQPSKINVINSSAATVPSNEPAVRPASTTVPTSTYRGTGFSSVRVPFRSGDLRLSNRIAAPRIEPGGSSAVRSNMILNVQPRLRFIGAPNLRYTSLPGPVHVTQLSGVPASNTPQLGSNWRPNPNVYNQSGAPVRPTGMYVGLSQQQANLKLREAAQNVMRVSDAAPNNAARQQITAARSNDTNANVGAAFRGQATIGEPFQTYRREIDNNAEQEADYHGWPTEAKRQKMSTDAYANPKRLSSNGSMRPLGNTVEQQSVRSLNEKARMKLAKAKLKARASLPARRASNATDCSESESYAPSQSKGTPASAQYNQSTSTATANATNGGAPNAPNAPNASQPRNDTAQRRACNCSRSQCLKLYCECFAHSQFCSNCNCVDCHNTVEFESDRTAAISATLERNPNAFQSKVGTIHGERWHTKGCNCKRSNCLKNYCECYEAKLACTARCKCVDCQNYRDSQAIDVQYRSARTRRLFNFDRNVQATASDHFAVPERYNARSLGGSQSNALRASYGGSPSNASNRLSVAERGSGRFHAPRDQNFDYGDDDECDEVKELTGNGTLNSTAAGNNSKAGPARTRDLHILPSDLRVRSIVAREQARNRVLPQEFISDEIVEATAVCLISRATNKGAMNQDAIQCDTVKISEAQLERSVLEEYGRCMERLITIAKQKQETIEDDVE